MADQQLVDYIKTQTRQGYTQQQLRDTLLQQGYNPVDVQNAIEEASKPTETQQTQKPKKTSLGVLVITLTFLYNGGTFVYKGINNLIRGGAELTAASRVNLVTAVIGDLYNQFYLYFSVAGIVIGSIFLLTCVGLWIKKNWGRKLAIFSSVLMMIFILTIPFSIIFIIILMNSNVKKQFA